MKDTNQKTQELIGVASVALAGVVQVSTSPGPFTIWNIIIGIPLLAILAVFSRRHALNRVEKIALACIWGFTAMSATGYITQGVYRYYAKMDPIFPDRLGTASTVGEWEAPGLYYLVIMIFFSLWSFHYLSTRSRDNSKISDPNEYHCLKEDLIASGCSLSQDAKGIEKIAKQLWVAEGMPQGRDEAIWYRAIQLHINERKYTPSPLLVICLLCIVLFLPFRWLALQQPIRVDYEISWVILTLISTITLSYVSMLNALRDRHAQPQFVERRPKLRQIMMLMSWALFLMFICISCLLIRIVLNTYFDFSPQSSSPGVLGFVAKLDYVILWSFFWSSLLRIAIFFVSYWKVLFA